MYNLYLIFDKILTEGYLHNSREVHNNMKCKTRCIIREPFIKIAQIKKMKNSLQVILIMFSVDKLGKMSLSFVLL